MSSSSERGSCGIAQHGDHSDHDDLGGAGAAVAWPRLARFLRMAPRLHLRASTERRLRLAAHLRTHRAPVWGQARHDGGAAAPLAASTALRGGSGRFAWQFKGIPPLQLPSPWLRPLTLSVFSLLSLRRLSLLRHIGRRLRGADRAAPRLPEHATPPPTGRLVPVHRETPSRRGVA